MHRILCLALLTACSTPEARADPEPPPPPAPSPAPGAPTVFHTYYYRASEAEYPGAATVTLNDASCRPIARVGEAFARALCVEGSGRLADGRVLNTAGRCPCALPCANGARVCWNELARDRYPWGLGNRDNALEPFVSWATDPAVIPSRTVVYAPEWDGVAIPRVGELGGFTHDGCFRADDVGGAIDGDHVDIFVGTAAMWRALEGVRPTRSRQHFVAGDPRCAHLSR